MRVDGAVAFWLCVSGGSALAAPAGFQGGEGMTFSLRVGPIPAGRARMSVGRPERINGRRLVAVHGDAHSAEWMRLVAQLDDDYKVIFDVDSLIPQKLSSHETGIRERTFTTEFDGAHVTLELELAKRRQHQSRTLLEAPRDPMTTLFQLRAAPLQTGDVIHTLVLDGPAVYRATSRVVGREQLAREGGVVGAIRLAVEATRIDDRGRPAKLPQRHITIWLSDDERRIPYRVSGDTDLGTAEVELTSYSATTATKPIRERPAAAHPPTPSPRIP